MGREEDYQTDRPRDTGPRAIGAPPGRTVGSATRCALTARARGW
jgi:hypothetical protein